MQPCSMCFLCSVHAIHRHDSLSVVFVLLQKCDVSGGLKREPVINCHLNLVVKLLLKCCKYSTPKDFDKIAAAYL